MKIRSRSRHFTNTPLLTKSFATDSRQQRRAREFQSEFKYVKRHHGFGVYSWAEGVTRKAARRIARRRATS